MYFLNRSKQKIKRYLYQAILIVLLIFVGISVHAEDYEIWTFVGAKTEWRKMDFSVSNATFFISDGNWYLNFVQFSVGFQSEKRINFGIAYRQEYVKIPEKVRIEYKPMLHLFYKKKWGAFEFRDRNRLEFRFIDKRMVNRFRNQLLMSYKRYTKFKPYFSTEFFFHFNNLAYVRQRSFLGFIVPVDNININLFAGHQINKNDPRLWSDKFMLGTSLGYRF